MSKKVTNTPLPKIKNVTKITGRERSQLLIYLNQAQWQQATKDAIDGVAKGLSIPPFGQFVISMPLLSGSQIQFSSESQPALSPPGWALMGLCHCNGDDKWCDIRWERRPGKKPGTPLNFFDASCQCFCPPDFAPGRYRNPCRLQITVDEITGRVNLGCTGECEDQEFMPPTGCNMVFWNVDLAPARFRFPIMWWTCVCQTRS